MSHTNLVPHYMFKYRFSFQERICQISGYKLCLLNSKNSRCNTSLSFGLQWITSFPTILFYFEKSLLESEWIPVQKRKSAGDKVDVMFHIECCTDRMIAIDCSLSTFHGCQQWTNRVESIANRVSTNYCRESSFPEGHTYENCVSDVAILCAFVIFCYLEISDTTTCNANWHWI